MPPAAALQPAAQPPTPAQDVRPPFDVWLGELRAEALARGVRAEVLDRALADVGPIEQVLERDRTQPEFTLSLDDYLRRRLSASTVRTARRMFDRHRSTLRRVSAAYKVQSRYLVALWGLESNFGRFSGVRPMIPTLATLAYDARRPDLFRRELLSALEIVNRGHIELERMKGSWAGAMGQPQFMPSSYLEYAVDFDGDGRRDIWAAPADVFASIANYLARHEWNARRAWGREVSIPQSAAAAIDEVGLRETGCRAERAMSPPAPLATWSERGVRAKNGGRLPAADVAASLVRLDGRAFLVYVNYEALLAYNCSHHYAMSVAMLADRLQ
jgi:membrane-bound lytic murein transglycosylase B